MPPLTLVVPEQARELFAFKTGQKVTGNTFPDYMLAGPRNGNLACEGASEALGELVEHLGSLSNSKSVFLKIPIFTQV